ncbi:MAG TPA: glycosyltransferase [Thermoanaerobaculia bacterium]|nr:glycosyltransferase [Thermoanaerobaculia bacterium]
MTAPEMPAAPEVTAVVPTVGRSPWLAACLQALRRQQGVRSLEIVVVDQSPRPLALPPGLADRVLRPERNLGFAGGTNLGLAAARGELLATVNDDAVVGPGWLAALAVALRASPRAAAAQGVNLIADDLDPEPEGHGGGNALAGEAAFPPERPGEDGRPGDDLPDRIDGCGLGWNRWWQAIQLGHGEPAPRPAAGGAAPPVEVFGVSATAALFRRTALEQVALGGSGQFFDPRLVSYYEDAELAGRLRAAGFSALLVPAARARHAGAASGRTAPASRDRWRLIYGNRYLAAARLLGRGLWPRLPLMMLRDLLDIAGPAALLGPRLPGPHRAPGRQLQPPESVTGAGSRRLRLAGMLAGWGRALRHLPAFARRGAPAPPPAEVARLSRWPLQPR